MTGVLSESGLTFDFGAAKRAERLDPQGVPLPHRMKLVDFVVEEAARVLLIEVKNPANAAAECREREIASFLKKVKGRKLINEQLVPKARDSYTFLHLMERDGKRMVFVAVLGISVDAALLVTFKDRLLARLRKEAQEPWKREYVSDCVVVTPKLWPQVFAEYALTRA